MTKRWRTSLLVWMLVISVLPLVPVLVFSALVSARHLEDLRETLYTAVPQRAEAAAHQVARRLDRAHAALTVLANGVAAQRGDLAALRGHARRVALSQDAGAHIELFNPEGLQVFRAGTSSEPGLKVAEVDLTLADRPGFRLSLWLPGGFVSALLQRQSFPPGWTGAVLDERLVIVGRSKDAERFVGQPVTDTLRAALTSGHAGVFRTTTKAGDLVYTAVAAIEDSGWRVAVGAPVALLEVEYRRSLLTLALGAGCSLLLAVLASVAVARWVRQRVRDLVATAQAPDAVAPSALPVTDIVELEPVSAALREVLAQALAQSGELNRARHDPLTGLATRAWLLHRAGADTEQRQRADDARERAAALFIDLDGFKQVNDRFGHRRGDEVLVQAAACILDAVRGHDLAGRWGGDEFVVYLTAPEGLVMAVARAVAERIVTRVGQLGDGIACSVGVAVDAENRHGVEALIHLADHAMLQAKREGKNRVVLTLP